MQQPFLDEDLTPEQAKAAGKNFADWVRREGLPLYKAFLNGICEGLHPKASQRIAHVPSPFEIWVGIVTIVTVICLTVLLTVLIIQQ